MKTAIITLIHGVLAEEENCTPSEYHNIDDIEVAAQKLFWLVNAKLESLGQGSVCVETIVKVIEDDLDSHNGYLT